MTVPEGREVRTRDEHSAIGVDLLMHGDVYVEGPLPDLLLGDQIEQDTRDARGRDFWRSQHL